MYTYSRFAGMFPHVASRFGLTAEQDGLWERELMFRGWRVSGQLLAGADDLLVRASSWRVDQNLFSGYRFNVLLWKWRAEYANMAGRSPRESAKKKPIWKGFLDYRLTAEELEALDEWQPTAGEIWEAVHTLLEAEYRLTLSYNAALKTASVTLIDDNSDRPSAGYGLASSDGDGASALKAAVYKHFTVLQGSWARLLDEPLTRGRRG